MSRLVTIFESIKNTSTPFHRDVETVLERIKDGRNQELIEKIRNCPNKDERAVLKKDLPAICFSGEFTNMSNEGIVTHSGLICLDLSGYKTSEAMIRAKGVLSKDEFVYSVFVSASGMGLKVLVKIPAEVENHGLYFNALEEWFDCPEFDSSCREESRVCYESFDPDIYVNPDSVTWFKQKELVAVTLTEEDISKSIVVSEQDIVARKVVDKWELELGFSKKKPAPNLYTLACSLCNYGVQESVSTPMIQAIAKENESSLSKTEVKNIVSSAYSDSKFNIKAFEDKERLDHLTTRIKHGTPKSEIKGELVEDGIAPKVADHIISGLENKAHKQAQRFWKKSDKGVVSLRHHLFRDFLVDHGFYKFYPEGSDNFIFVQKASNRVRNIMDNRIKDFTLNYVDERITDRSIWDFFAENTKYFKENFLSMLPDIKIDFIEDTSKEAYLYFRNVAVRVTASDLDIIEYEELNGWVWHDQVIDRNFEVIEDYNCDFKTFVSKISGESSERVKSIESTLGYLMHGYKDPSYSPAVIINDEIISDGPEGGTGKGLLMMSISHIKKMVTIDGKQFDFSKSFPYQTVQQDTQILLFDDVKQKFNFEYLFSVITQGLDLEKKNKDMIHIPFSRSPKVAITTNYGIGGTANSFARRKWDIELVQHYRHGFTPLEEFGKRLFDDWSEQEWVAFDNYMIRACLQRYLKNGLIKSGFKNLETRNFISNTTFDFYEWITQDDLEWAKPGIKHSGIQVIRAFVSEYPDYDSGRRYSLKQSTFYKWMLAYGEYKYGVKAEKSRDSSGVWIKFVEGKEPIEDLFSIG